MAKSWTMMDIPRSKKTPLPDFVKEGRIKVELEPGDEGYLEDLRFRVSNATLPAAPQIQSKPALTPEKIWELFDQAVDEDEKAHIEPHERVVDKDQVATQ